MDKYNSFEDLKNEEREGNSFRVVINEQPNSLVTVIAPHGGSIEPGTSEISKAIAGDNLSIALFEGIKRSRNSELHITSTNFDEPRCLALVQLSQNIIAIHGESSTDSIVYIGGKDINLIRFIRSALESKDFIVKKHENSNLQGISTENICNRGTSRKGVQLELSKGLRETFFDSLNSNGRKNSTARFSIFVDAIREGLHNAGIL